MNDPRFWRKFVIALLATWRITHLLAREDGPADVLARLRQRLGSGEAGKLMDCFHCLSVWVAAPMTMFLSRRSREFVPVWLALSGAACLLERIGQEPLIMRAAPQDKDDVGANNDAMLRTKTSGAPGRLDTMGGSEDEAGDR